MRVSKLTWCWQLIEELYSPHPSRDVIQIQQSLQVVQRSDEGIHLANELLINPSHSSNVKYFGALTLTVQLTTNVDSHETLWKLFKCNLLHLSKCCNLYISDTQAYASLITIIKKLMSNLSLIFTNINESDFEASNCNVISQWNNPVNTLLQLLSSYNNVPLHQWTTNPEMDQILHQYINAPITYDNLIQSIQSSPACNKLLLMFTQIIVEDLTKFQTKKNRMSKVYEIVHDHLYISTMALINANLTIIDCSDDIIFDSISAWISYISMVRNVSRHGRMDLNEMFENMVDLILKSTQESDNFAIAEKIIGIIGTVFANDPTLMGFELREKIEIIFIGVSKSGNLDISKHNWMLQYMNHLVTNEMTEELKELAICIVDFLQINTLDVCNKLFTTISSTTVNHEALQQYVKVLLQMTNFPLVPVLREHFSVRMVDIWLDLSEAYTNLSPETLSEQGPQLATEIFQQVVQILLPKISLINKGKIIEEDSDETAFHEFDDFRSAVSDLMESLWSILGNDKLTNILISGLGNHLHAINHVENTDNDGIFDIEAIAFLLNTLLRDMTLSESPWVCDVMDSCEFLVGNILMLLQHGFESPGNSAGSHALKLDFVRTSSVLLGTIAGYFQQSPSQLDICIDTLFQGLQITTLGSGSDTELNNKLEILTIKALSTLCDVCRQELSSSLDKFLAVLSSVMSPNSNYSSFTREKLVRSVGYIIEAQQSGPEQQGNYILQLLSMFENLIRQTMMIPTQQMQQQRIYLHCLFSCISELGSSLIREEEDENLSVIERMSGYNEYWKNDPLVIRAKIMDLIEFILNDTLLSVDPEFVEVACLILGKALNLPDDEPHFLKYSMSEIMRFLLKQADKTSILISLPYYVYLLEKLINRFKDQLSSHDCDFIIEQVFLKRYQDSIVSDPDSLQSTINFINCILDCKPSLLIHSKHWMTFILPEFLKLLSVREKFTIVAITKFWVKILSNRRYTQQDLATMQQQIISLGQDLVYQTLFGLYHTQRSDINNYTDILRALVAKFPLQIKMWLVNALPQVSSHHKDHEKLINKLLVTRGNRAAGNAILEWWLECNQLPAL